MRKRCKIFLLSSKWVFFSKIFNVWGDVQAGKWLCKIVIKDPVFSICVNALPSSTCLHTVTAKREDGARSVPSGCKENYCMGGIQHQHEVLLPLQSVSYTPESQGQIRSQPVK